MKGVIWSGLAYIAAVATALTVAQAATRSERFEIPAGKDNYVGDVPMLGRACFKVLSKATGAPAMGHFRGLINGDPIDLDRHLGGRCLDFVRDLGLGMYRVYVAAEWGEDLIVIRTVDEAPHDWRPAPGFHSPHNQPPT